MKKIFALLLLSVTTLVQAGPWDFNIQQYDVSGFGLINRLTVQPAGGVPGILTFDPTTTPPLPKLVTMDSTLNISGLVMGVSSATLAAKFDVPTGNTGQYLRGDGSLATFPATPPSLALTTTGSGAATYNSGTGALNIPTPSVSSGTVTSITAGTGLSGGVITTAGTVSMPNTGTAGTYDATVTTDAQGRITAGTNRSQSAQTRTLNSAYQISATRGALVNYSVRIVTTASIGGNQDGDVILEIASDSGFTTNVQTLSITQNAQSISLAIVLNSVQTQTGVLSGYVPAGYYARLRTSNNTGTPTYLYRAGQEVLM